MLNNDFYIYNNPIKCYFIILNYRTMALKVIKSSLKLKVITFRQILSFKLINTLKFKLIKLKHPKYNNLKCKTKIQYVK